MIRYIARLWSNRSLSAFFGTSMDELAELPASLIMDDASDGKSVADALKAVDLDPNSPDYQWQDQGMVIDYFHHPAGLEPGDDIASAEMAPAGRAPDVDAPTVSHDQPAVDLPVQGPHQPPHR